MRGRVLFNSVYGNTAVVARAVAEGLDIGPAGAVQRAAARDFSWQDVERLVVESATCAFRPMATVVAAPRTLPLNALRGVCVAAFDTHMDIAALNNRLLTQCARLFGYAAEKLERLLVSWKAVLAAPAAWFTVEDTRRSLRAGEHERAAAWERELARGAHR